MTENGLQKKLIGLGLKLQKYDVWKRSWLVLRTSLRTTGGPRRTSCSV